MGNLSNRTLEKQVKGAFRFRCKQQNARCAYCRQIIDYKAPRNHRESFEAAHKLSVKTHPHLAYDPNNYIAAHSRCNRQAQEKPFEERPWAQAKWR